MPPPTHDLASLRDLGIFPIPRGLRYDESKAQESTLLMNIFLGVSCTFRTLDYLPYPDDAQALSFQ